MKTRMLFAGIVLLAGCGRATDPANNAGSGPEAPVARQNAAAPPKPAPSEPKVLIEPKGPIDPTSVEAAGQVVQHYGALIEEGRWTASRGYWGSAEAAQAFERNFRDYADVHVEIGDLSDPEGAAGSIYVTEPVTFYGKTNGGGTYRGPADVTLRRVNDVDGSTAAQRRWHIEQIEWKGAD
jgi:hypothetical protein